MNYKVRKFILCEFVVNMWSIWVDG